MLEDFLDFHGNFDYYYFNTRKSYDISTCFLHQALCIRRPDKGFALRIELKLGTENVFWFASVSKTEWEPNKGKDHKFYTSQHKWHAAAAIFAFAKHTKQFGTYNLITNNCIHWSEGIRSYMEQNPPPADCQMIRDTVGLINYANTQEVALKFCPPKQKESSRATSRC